MPWYKFTSQHGPGHMSHSECYHWFDKTPGKEELREEWEEAFRDYDDVVGKAVPVPRLPKRVLNSKKLSQVYQLQGAVETLKERYGVEVQVQFPKGFVEALQAERTAYLEADRAAAVRREKKRQREALARAKAKGWVK